MINEQPIIYIGLGTHERDSKRVFTVGTTTRKGDICREYSKHMRILWVESLPGFKTKGAWDAWDTRHMKPWLNKHFEYTRVYMDATMMKEIGCKQSRTNSWWMASKSPTQQLDFIVAVVRERLYKEIEDEKNKNN